MSNAKSLRNEIREKEKAKKQRKLIIPALVLIGVIAIFLAVNFLVKSSIKAVQYSNVDGQTVGLASAPIKVEEYSNFNCIHCKVFSDTEEEVFVKNFVDTGKVQFTFRHFPFNNDNTGNAVEASYCAVEQNKFWPMKSLLFKYNSYTGAFEDGNLANYAKTAGLDTQAFSDCLKSDKYVAKIAEDRDAAIALGLDGTPYFFVNGQKVSQAELITTVETQLAALGK
ncbi:MAG TPA: thioredoxin domain-containing protein [Anaerolineaceae bacterium]|nr:thioredoxin domain-containing protein [Anaerolineaceae bacterium]